MKKIAAVVVTYNRVLTLIDCLKAIDHQVVKPQTVYILDNASTDGTSDILKDNGYVDTLKDGILYKYIRNDKNEGGAGGFYLGMKTAFEDEQYDALWVMDDDGIPDRDCLKNLLPHLEKYDYISPLVVALEDERMTSFMGCTVEEIIKRAKGGLVIGAANPFNGILYSSKLIEKVGFPKKEMFIWGDEINYELRCRKNGFPPVMVVDAIHRHPINRQETAYYWGRHSFTVSDKDWKLFCYIRNKTYNNKEFFGKKQCIKSLLIDFFKFFCYYGLKLHNYKKMKLVVDAMGKGYKADFTGLEKYFKS